MNTLVIILTVITILCVMWLILITYDKYYVRYRFWRKFAKNKIIFNVTSTLIIFCSIICWGLAFYINKPIFYIIFFTISLFLYCLLPDGHATYETEYKAYVENSDYWEIEMDKDGKTLLNNLDKIHTTKMGIDRIKKNLNLDLDDVVTYLVNKIKNPNCMIERKGKNWYVTVDGIVITINAYSYTIITAHKFKNID